MIVYTIMYCHKHKDDSNNSFRYGWHKKQTHEQCGDDLPKYIQVETCIRMTIIIIKYSEVIQGKDDQPQKSRKQDTVTI